MSIELLTRSSEKLTDIDVFPCEVHRRQSKCLSNPLYGIATNSGRTKSITSIVHMVPLEELFCV